MTRSAPSRTRLEVWGDPIEHSRSPALHSAAYRQLGLDWSYGRRRVDVASFSDEWDGLDASFRGLSCTMPLKEAALRASSRLDRRAQLTGAVNTLLLGDDGVAGFNTDVGGLVRALAEQGIDDVRTARVVGSGATAASAVVALTELGARRIVIEARSVDRARGLSVIGEAAGSLVEVRGLDDEAERGHVDVTIGALAGGVVLGDSVSDGLAEHGGILFDVAYSPWPSGLARAWERAGRTACSGASMLLHQALLQVRIFVTGSVDAPLPDEPLVLAAMRTALVGD